MKHFSPAPVKSLSPFFHPRSPSLRMRIHGLLLVLCILSLCACQVPVTPAAPSAPARGSSTSTLSATATPSATPASPASTPTSGAAVPSKQPTPSSASLQRVSGSYQFTEGPAVDSAGNVYFSDINAGKIYRWTVDGSVTTFVSGLDKPNGLEFDAKGMLIACEGGSGRILSIDAQGKSTVLADKYNGLRFNEPNDLWIDPQGGIYFTDPVYTMKVVQGGEYVYYLSPDRSQVTRVITDLVRPNGIVGTADGKKLYVADHGAGKTYSYTIGSGGALSGKQLAVSAGSDGMALDASGNLYLTNPNKVQVYDPTGKLLREIPTTENPTNLAFAGANRSLLFITARSEVYTLALSGSPAAAKPALQSPASLPTSTASVPGFVLSSPTVTQGGALPVEYTCDGASATLALSWSGAPAGTLSYAVIMHHIAAPDDIHWYWVLYNLSASVTSLAKNTSGIGTLGNNSVNGRTEYSPPCSKGPGLKNYTYTVYALSAQPKLSVPAAQVNRAALLEAIKSITLASAELNVTYTR